MFGVAHCLVFVLDPKLQDGKKIPKWNQQLWQGQFLGFSDEHMSIVVSVHHLFPDTLVLNSMLYLMIISTPLMVLAKKTK
jgi:hypothetical protein